MTKLTKLQTMLIEHAKDRADGALLPAPMAFSATDAALARALTGLVKNGLAEASTTQGEEDDEAAKLILTAAGLMAASDKDVSQGEGDARSTKTLSRPGGKMGAVLKAVERKRGATLAELGEVTGWQPHTTRSALTRLRQRGFPAVLSEQGGRKAYRLQA